MAEADNAGRRLHDVLVRAADQATTLKQPRDARAVWSVTLLGEDDSPAAAFLPAFGQLLGLPLRFRNELRLLRDYDLAYVEGALLEVDRMLSQLLNLKWADYSKRLTAAALPAISLSAQAVAQRAPKRSIDQNGLSRAAERLRNVYDDIGQLDLDVQFQASLQLMIADVIAAIDNFAVSGAQPLEMALGSIVMRLGAEREQTKALESKQAGKKILAVIGGLAAVVGLANSSVGLARQVDALPWGTAPSKQVITSCKQDPQDLPALPAGPQAGDKDTKGSTTTRSGATTRQRGDK